MSERYAANCTCGWNRKAGKGGHSEAIKLVDLHLSQPEVLAEPGSHWVQTPLADNYTPGLINL